MKVYDIALTLIRVLVLVDVIRELANLVSDVITAAIAFGILSSSPATNGLAGEVVMRALTLARLGNVAFAVVVSVIIFVAAPRIARFATKFTDPQPAAA